MPSAGPGRALSNRAGAIVRAAHTAPMRTISDTHARAAVPPSFGAAQTLLPDSGGSRWRRTPRSNAHAIPSCCPQGRPFRPSGLAPARLLRLTLAQDALVGRALPRSDPRT